MTQDPFRPNLLDGETVVITGGGSGINLGIARRFARQGARVILVGRTREKLDRAAAEIDAEVGDSGRARGVVADVRDETALAEAMAVAAGEEGRIEIVVAGAAGNFPAPAAGMSANGFRAVVDIDLNGTFNTFRTAFDHLCKPGARLIAISAPQAFVPTPMQAHVCAAKSGVDQLLKTLAMEWGPLGIRVNGIAPGPIDDTEGMRRLAPGDARQRLVETIPLRRFGAVEEMADVALFLASPAAAYLSGHVIVADGGWSLMGGRILTQLFA
jgi:NAD(P)-dependent dehydrogenase (short-subunit alcohol dehydrogenase family)